MRSRRLFDEIRKKWVAATPEEIVRQSLVLKMVRELGYPKELIALEKELGELPHLKNVSDVPKRRADILCYTSGGSSDAPLSPLLLIECKEQGLTSAAREQVMGYNHFVKAPFIGIASKDGIEVGLFDPHLKTYNFFFHLPSYSFLVDLGTSRNLVVKKVAKSKTH